MAIDRPPHPPSALLRGPAEPDLARNRQASSGVVLPVGAAPRPAPASRAQVRSLRSRPSTVAHLAEALLARFACLVGSARYGIGLQRGHKDDSIGKHGRCRPPAWYR